MITKEFSTQIDNNIITNFITIKEDSLAIEFDVFKVKLHSFSVYRKRLLSYYTFLFEIFEV